MAQTRTILVGVLVLAIAGCAATPPAPTMPPPGVDVTYLPGGAGGRERALDRLGRPDVPGAGRRREDQHSIEHRASLRRRDGFPRGRRASVAPPSTARCSSLRKVMVRLAGIEPATLGLEGRCSIRLSYRRGKH